ncbi:hypothetical protein BJV82DRAFT_277548 [Fennellomyces sp. T-0311]|nr:hypothetical protein BJV82DRAFT_277548 [Fennellomyces sp. T-0311]
MGHKRVTYGIGLVKKSPYKAEIQEMIKEYRDLQNKDDRDRAAAVGVNLAELIVEHVECFDTETEEAQERLIERALRACEYAYPILAARKEDHLKQLRSCLSSQIKILSWRGCFSDAIDILDEFIPLINDEEDDLYLREVYHEVAGLYFCRGHSEDAKFDDYDNALRFYKLERRKLDSLPEDIEYLADWKRSSNLNMGILEAKEVGSFESAIKNLTTAYNMAQELGKREEKRVTVWEMGNAYRNHGNLKQLVKAQQQELNLIRRYQFKDKEAPCLEEMLLTQLELGNYDKSRELYDELKVLLEDSEDSLENLERLSDAISIIQSRKLALTHQPEVALLAPVYNRAVLYLELGKH